MLVVILFAVTVLLWLVIRFRRLNSYVKDVPNISLTLINLFKSGNLNMYDINIKLSNSFENIAKAWIGLILTVFLDQPDDAQTILNSRDCLDRPYFYRFLANGDGLITANGKYKQLKRFLVFYLRRYTKA